MSSGLNRHNDTPIGGLQEFRANMLTSSFVVDTVPVYDGEKFVAGSQTGLANAYGGLAMNEVAGFVADGTALDGWEGVMPLGGSPVNVTPNASTGVIVVSQPGTYDVTFSANLGGLTNANSYFFELAGNGTGLGFGSIVVGSVQVDTQSTSFSLQVQAAGGGNISILVTGAGAGFDVISASITVSRIG